MLEKEFGRPEEIGNRIASAKGRFRTYLKKEARKLPMAVAVALVIALLIRWQVVEAYTVANDGMAPVVSKGCHVMVNKLAYRFGTPKEGDVVVYRKDGCTTVAMVKGTEGGLLKVVKIREGEAPFEIGRDALVGRVWLTTR